MAGMQQPCVGSQPILLNTLFGDVVTIAGPGRINIYWCIATNKGIYEFDGDTLKICIAMNSDGDRPSDFTAKQDSKRSLMVWKRVKK